MARVLDVTPTNRASAPEFRTGNKPDGSLEKGLLSEGVTFSKEPTTEATATSTPLKLNPDENLSLHQQFEFVVALYQQGRKEEWQTAFKNLLERQRLLDNLNKEKSNLYNQPKFIMLLTEHNLANSKRKFESGSTMESGRKILPEPRYPTVSVTAHNRNQQNTKDSRLSKYETFMDHPQRNLNKDFAEESRPARSLWAPLYMSTENPNNSSLTLENLHLVKRPPLVQRVVPGDKTQALTKTSKSKEIPINRIRSKKISPVEKSQEACKRRGSFDEIETDEEFDSSLF